MKVYISVDLEGVSGTTSWKCTEMSDIEYPAAARQMTMEALAACEGALCAKSKEIYVKDAHETGRNLDLSMFPKEVKVISGWTGAPESMIAKVDKSFDALLFIGYHSPSGCNGSPLAHTMNRDNHFVKINGKLASEFVLHAYTAAHYGVPVAFLSGDKMLCEQVNEFDPNIKTVAIKEGVGNATINLSPSYACELIRDGVTQALTLKKYQVLKLPEYFEMEIFYKDHSKARRASFYPGVRISQDGYTIYYNTDSIIDLMSARMFIL